MDLDNKQKDIVKLKNELREKLLRRKLSKNSEVRLGFGGRVILPSELGEQTTPDHALPKEVHSILSGITDAISDSRIQGIKISKERTIGRLNVLKHSEHEIPDESPTQLTKISEGGYSEFKQAYSNNTPQPEFILDDQRKVLMTPKAYKAKMKRMRKAQEDTAALKEQKLLRLKAQQKAQRLSKNKTKYDNCDRVLINDVVYAVTDNGITLAPLLDPDCEKSEYLVWNNWRYSRNRYGILKRNVRTKSRPQCRYFSRTGICQKGIHCRYVHDMNRVMLCRQFVVGKCDHECIYSHERTEFNTPICRFHLEGKCLNSQCRYIHRIPRHAQDKTCSVWTCRPFAVGGWCLRGSMCPFLHLYNCPDFEEVGVCPRGKNCPLAHIITKRIQELMATPQDTGGVVVARDTDKRKLINSYSVEPSLLFVKPETSSFYIDQGEDEADDSQLVIHLGTSEGEEEEEEEEEDEEVEEPSRLVLTVKGEIGNEERLKMDSWKLEMVSGMSDEKMEDNDGGNVEVEAKI